MINQLHVISFGYAHAPAPLTADLTIDLTDWSESLDLDPQAPTGLHYTVFAYVMEDGALNTLLDHLVPVIKGLYARNERTVTVAFGDRAGRQCTPAVARMLVSRFRQLGLGAHATHRDLTKTAPAGSSS